MANVTLNVEGMHCASCVARVEKALAAAPGVRTARVNLATEQASVETLGAHVDTAPLLHAVEAAGYGARLAPADRRDDLAQRQRRESARWGVRVLVAAAGLTVVFALHHAPALGAAMRAWLALAVATALQSYVAWPFYVGAAKRLAHWSSNMDTLVALGTTAAYLAGAAATVGLVGAHGGHRDAASPMTFMDSAMILTFITFGKYLEARTKGRASAAIVKLLQLAPPRAIVMRDGQPVDVDVGEVRRDEILLVRPGDRVALDGEIIQGQSQLDEAWLTGESLPVERQPGQNVLAGSIN
ncbi:MAG: cation-translocating P-type ATPase, partial [Planctomycetales bacterium]|nr:cation-translocating P-type ATPase [Planctomycetales bacterium]